MISALTKTSMMEFYEVMSNVQIFGRFVARGTGEPHLHALKTCDKQIPKTSKRELGNIER